MGFRLGGLMKRSLVIRLIEAGAAVTSALIQAGVRLVVGMTLRAVRFGPMVVTRVTCPEEGRRDATRVFGMSHWLQMRRSDARSSTAKMVKFWPSRARSVFLFISEAVCSHGFTLKAESPITLVIQSAPPQPAWAEIGAVFGKGSVLINLSPKPHRLGTWSMIQEWVAGCGVAVSPKPHVMRLAIALRLMFPAASLYRAKPHVNTIPHGVCA